MSFSFCFYSLLFDSPLDFPMSFSSTFIWIDKLKKKPFLYSVFFLGLEFSNIYVWTFHILYSEYYLLRVLMRWIIVKPFECFDRFFFVTQWAQFMLFQSFSCFCSCISLILVTSTTFTSQVLGFHLTRFVIYISFKYYFLRISGMCLSPSLNGFFMYSWGLGSKCCPRFDI